MTLILVIVAVGIVILLIGALLKPSNKPKTKGPSILDSYSTNGKIWVKKMCELYDSGLTWQTRPELLYEKTFGITLTPNQYGVKVSSYWKDIGVPDDYLDADENTAKYRTGSFFHDMQLWLSLRFSYQYKPLKGKIESQVMKEYGLNIHSDEAMYYHSVKIDWYEEKIVRTNVKYTGFRYHPGGNMNYSTGSFTMIKNEISDYVLLDRGTLYITNKRIIFVGNESRENRTIRLDDLLELSIYKDGLLLGKANGKKPLLYVPEYKSGLLPRDNLNCIIRVIDRLMSGTQDQDLTPVTYEVV